MFTLNDEDYERLMKQWDYWRKEIADGDTSSAPRDWFESTIDVLLEKASERYKPRGLTDEEIKEIIEKHSRSSRRELVVEIIAEILKKSSMK